MGAEAQRHRDRCLAGSVDRHEAQDRAAVAEGDEADRRARLGSHGGRQQLDLPEDGGRGRRAERRRCRGGDHRRGGAQEHTDGVGGGVGRDQVHAAVAVQVGRSHAEGVIAAGRDSLLEETAGTYRHRFR